MLAWFQGEGGGLLYFDGDGHDSWLMMTFQISCSAKGPKIDIFVANIDDDDHDAKS